MTSGSIGEIPFAPETLGAGFAGKRKKTLQVRWIIDIDRNSRQIQHDAGFAGGLGGGVMRFKAVVAEAQRKQSCGASEGGVGAASVARWDQNAAFFWGLLENFFKFPCLNEWNVGGDHQCAVDAALDANAGGHLDGAGFSGIVGIGDDFKTIFAGKLDCEWIAGDDAPPRADSSSRSTRP